MHYFSTAFLLVVFLQAGWAEAKLPREVRDFLTSQQGVFESVMSKLDSEQYALILERYQDRLLESRIFQSIKIDRNDLADFMRERFAFRTISPRGRKKDELGDTLVDQALLEKRIAKLIAAFNGKQRDNILDLEFVCGDSKMRFPFEVFSGYEPIEFRIFGIGIPNSIRDRPVENSCLVLEIPAHDTESAISWIGTRETACPIPANRAGECLLSVAEKMSQALKMKTVTLRDEAEVLCKDNRKPVNFARLKIYQEGESWYQRLGYMPKNIKAYEEQLSGFRNYPFAKLKDAFASHNPKSGDAKFIKTLGGRFDAFLILKKTEPTTSEFMTWLWDADCATYQRLDAFLFEKAKTFEFARLYPETTTLTKELGQ